MNLPQQLFLRAAAPTSDLDYTLTRADLLSKEDLLSGILNEFYSCPACGKTAVSNEAMLM